EMQAATGGLRHGLLCDLVGGDNDGQDVRTASVQRLMTKFSVDPTDGSRAGRVAVDLYRQLEPRAAPADPDDERNTRKLGWAAQLHEIGSHISHSDYHKHGAYILDNADAMGFSQAELHRLSMLVLGQRGKLRKLDADFDDELFVLQLMALRLAIIFCHARREPDTGRVAFSRDARQARRLVLACEPGWAETYPQSAHLLREETLAWQKTPWSLGLAGL
nr:exopolyphosphatase [Rhodoferax sp.]